MKIELTSDQEALIRIGVESGRIDGAEDAVHQALELWETRERARIEFLAVLAESEADLAAGRTSSYTDESLPTLAQELKNEARAMRERKRVA